MYICIFIFARHFVIMKKKVAVSLIIATYNWPEALDLCLKSILAQTFPPTEVIIADDGSDERTANLIRGFAAKVNFNVYHEWHEDKGFRKSIILNRAINRASFDYIIQIDGDVIIAPRFIEDHLCMAEQGCFIRGTRACLSANITRRLLIKKRLTRGVKLQMLLKQPPNALRLPFFLARFLTRKELSGRRVKGCNMAFWRKDLVAVNGYDNSLQGWGHEDEELSWRLINGGVKKKIIKCSAIVYHLYHRQLPREQEPFHREFMEFIKEKNIVRTKDGLEKI